MPGLGSPPPACTWTPSRLRRNLSSYAASSVALVELTERNARDVGPSHLPRPSPGVLADQGAVTLDDSVASVIPGCPEQRNKVSACQLLTHTSGMSHWCDLPGFDPAQPFDLAGRLTLLLAALLTDPPGQTWRYSSPGYIVLSVVLESAGQRPYSELVHEHIIDRFGLTRTTVGHGGGCDAAHGYKCGVPTSRDSSPLCTAAACCPKLRNRGGTTSTLR